MDKQIKKKIDSYTAACNDLAREFTKRIGISWRDCYWAADEAGGILIMTCEYSIGMQDIIDGLRLSAKWDDYLAWYNYSCDVHETGNLPPNFKHWLKGCPRATEEELKALREKVKESEEMFLKSCLTVKN